MTADPASYGVVIMKVDSLVAGRRGFNISPSERRKWARPCGTPLAGGPLFFQEVPSVNVSQTLENGQLGDI